MRFTLLLRVVYFLLFISLLQGSWGCKSSAKNSGTAADTHTGTDADTHSDTDTGTDSDKGFEKVTLKQQNETVFAMNKILEYHVTIDDDLLADLDANGIEEEYKKASLRVTGDGVSQTFEEVGIRYKGAGSIAPCWAGGKRNYDGYCARISMKFKFNKYDKDARFYGLKKLNMHSMLDDATLMREPLGYSLFADAGIVAPRTAYAKLYINGELSGLYVAVEVVDGRFTHFRFPESKDGNLYKEIWPKSNVTESRALEHLETNDDPEDNPNVSDFLQFKDAIAKADESNFESVMKDWVDLDLLLRYVAVDRALRNWDGIMGFYSADTSHNFFWYFDKGATNQFVLIPWDMDNTMGEFDLLMDPKGWCGAVPVPDWNMVPLNCDERATCMSVEVGMTPPRCDHLIDMLALTQWDAFTEIGDALLNDVLSYDSMNDKISRWSARIEDAVDEDPMMDVDDWKKELDAFRNILLDAIFGFKEHLDEGLIDEVNPTPRDELELVKKITVGELRTDIVNGFEFDSEDTDEWTKALDGWVLGSADSRTTISHSVNTTSPITGTADLKLTADFVSTNGAWSEWAHFQLNAPKETDISGYRYLWFSAASETAATMRIVFRSPAYRDYGNIYEMFSHDYDLSATPTFYYIDLKKVSYPKWAKDAWKDGEGWPPPDNEARKNVLSHFTGLEIQLMPTVDTSGEMPADTELMTVSLDNIYFE
ncbi:MAG: CotH kinase family protein [Deltaproteobacteria bacterium]|nr:CotH kinase family protein [Deltaproteobacteria bacterium]